MRFEEFGMATKLGNSKDLYTFLAMLSISREEQKYMALSAG